MYLMRFSYDLLPANREKAVALIRRDVEAAKARGLKARHTEARRSCAAGEKRFL